MPELMFPGGAVVDETDSVVEVLSKRRRNFGEHLTPVKIFNEFILPEIKNKIQLYRWVDLFAGEGNLILPILNLIPMEKRVDFFKNHIFLFDVQKELVERCIENAMKYGIPESIARLNILQIDTLREFPKNILNYNLPIFHITNPPYLYLGYIAKHEETKKYLEYFKGGYEGYQDLYQIALKNDLLNGIKEMIYIIPSNFLFGFSVSNKIRNDFLRYYNINKSVIFEKDIFEHTGTNVVMCFFNKKKEPKEEPISFDGIKINKTIHIRKYILNPKNQYRAGDLFDSFVSEYVCSKPLSVNYYLTIDEAHKNMGDDEVKFIDANNFEGDGYKKGIIKVSKELSNKIKNNILFIRTVDTGSMNGRAGLYVVQDTFGSDAIFVTKSKYRTHPIQIFFEPAVSKEDQILLKDFFNFMLENFRKKTDSEFMTTYKYSDSDYVRKYLGLSQAKEIIKTLPILSLTSGQKADLKELINKKDAENILKLIKSVNGKSELRSWL